MDYNKMTNDEFDGILEDIIHEMTAQEILSYGDVSNILREELNNEILSRWETKQEIEEQKKQ